MSIDAYAPLEVWQRVPERVVALLPHAQVAKFAHEKAAADSGILALSAATYVPAQNAVYVYTAQPVAEDAWKKYASAMATENITAAGVSMTATPDWSEELVIKTGTLSIPGLPTVWNGTQKLLGGPNPLTNGIVTSLLGAGAGYVGGTLAENLFPERYIQRGKLRRTLAALGALGGVGMAGLNAYSNARALHTGMLRGLITHNETPIPDFYGAGEKKAYNEDFLNQQMNQQLFTSGMQRQNQQNAMMSGMGMGAPPPLFTPSVPVPQFNQAVWNDVQRGMATGNFNNHTPPQYAAAVTGLMAGTSANARSPIIRPIDVVTGIASAGVGLGTAHIVGKTLSALAGLTPEGQNKLQELGLWGGMMHAVVPPLFGAQ